MVTRIWLSVSTPSYLRAIGSKWVMIIMVSSKLLIHRHELNRSPLEISIPMAPWISRSVHQRRLLYDKPRTYSILIMKKHRTHRNRHNPCSTRRHKQWMRWSMQQIHLTSRLSARNRRKHRHPVSLVRLSQLPPRPRVNQWSSIMPLTMWTRSRIAFISKSENVASLINEHVVSIQESECI